MSVGFWGFYDELQPSPGNKINELRAVNLAEKQSIASQRQQISSFSRECFNLLTYQMKILCCDFIESVVHFEKWYICIPQRGSMKAVWGRFHHNSIQALEWEEFHYSLFIPLILLANCISFGIIVTRFAWIAHKLLSSKSPTKCASAASCSASIAVPCQR